MLLAIRADLYEPVVWCKFRFGEETAFATESEILARAFATMKLTLPPG